MEIVDSVNSCFPCVSVSDWLLLSQLSSLPRSVKSCCHEFSGDLRDDGLEVVVDVGGVDVVGIALLRLQHQPRERRTRPFGRTDGRQPLWVLCQE